MVRLIAQSILLVKILPGSSIKYIETIYWPNFNKIHQKLTTMLYFYNFSLQEGVVTADSTVVSVSLQQGSVVPLITAPLSLTFRNMGSSAAQSYCAYLNHQGYVISTDFVIYFIMFYIILLCFILYHHVLYYVIMYDIILSDIIWYYYVLYYIIMYYITLLCIILYYYILYYYILSYILLVSIDVAGSGLQMVVGRVARAYMQYTAATLTVAVIT